MTSQGSGAQGHGGEQGDDYKPQVLLGPDGEIKEINIKRLDQEDDRYSPSKYNTSPGKLVTETIHRETLNKNIELSHALDRSREREAFLQNELDKERDRNQLLNLDLRNLYEEKVLLEHQLEGESAENKARTIENEAIRKLKLTTESGAMDALLALKKLSESQKHATSTSNDFELRLKRERDLRSKVLAEKETLAQRLQEMNQRMREVETENEKLKLDLSQKEESVMSVLNDLKMKEEMKAHRDQLTNENRNLRIQLEEARTRVQTETTESSQHAMLSLERIRTLLQVKVNYEKRMDELENELMEKEFHIKQLILMKEEYLIKIAELEKRLADESTYEHRFKADRELIAKLRLQNASLRDELNKLQKENNDLTKQNHLYYLKIKQLEEEIAYLNERLNRKVEVRPPSPPSPPKRRLTKYKAVVGDEIDIALAEFINAQPPEIQLKCIFFREGRGLYYYGTRRIFISLQHGHLIVRVGGGYMNISEFIEEHYEYESQRVHRKRSLSQLHDGAKLVQITGTDGVLITPLSDRSSRSPDRYRNSLSHKD